MKLLLHIDTEYIDSLLPHISQAVEEDLLTTDEVVLLVSDEVVKTMKFEVNPNEHVDRSPAD